MNKSYWVFVMFTLVVAVSCKHHDEGEKENMVFTVTTPLQKDTTIYKEYVAQIHAIQHIDVMALEKGYIQKIFIDEGEHVKKGQIMFQILPIVYQAELKKAEAELEFAEIEYNNTKKLSDNQVVSTNELALAKAKYEKAKAEKALAESHFNFTTIQAPFDGIVGVFHVRMGSLVDEGDLLTTLSDNSKLWVYFNVPEAEYLNYEEEKRQGNDLAVKLEMANKEVFGNVGIIETIEADFNNETGNIAFRATFNNIDNLLRHGETGNILMPVILKNTLLIPQKATYEILEKKYVFVMDKDHVLHQREIKVAAEMSDLYVVSHGLSKTDHILFEGLRKVKDGDKIESKFVEPNSLISNLEVHAE